MAKDEYDVAEKKKGPLDAEFVTEEAKADSQPVSFFRLYSFASRWNVFWIFTGLLATVGTGVLTPLNVLIFGSLTGNIIEYAMAIANPSTNDTALQEATDKFINDINDFAIYNSLIGIGMLILSYISTETFNYTAIKQIFRIRSSYLKSIFNQDIAWFDKNDSGDFASRMSDDLGRFEEGIGEKVPMFLNFQVSFITCLVLALIKGWELALVCLISLPVTMIAVLLVAFLTSKLAKKELDAYGAAGAIAEEVFTSLRTVIAFGGAYKEAARYDEQLVHAKNNNIRRHMLNAIGFGLLWFFIYSSYGLAFWYAVRLMLNQRSLPTDEIVYTPGNIVTVFFSVMQGSMNFGVSSPYIEAFASAKAAGGKIFEVIDNAPVINQSKERGDKPDKIRGNIIFKNVRFNYPSRNTVPILQGINLEIKAGQTIALVGSSGCGKSTCIQMVQRFYDPLEGEIQIDHKNIKDYNLTWLRNRIGVVSQEPVLFGTTIEENIRFGNTNATYEDIKLAAKKANAHGFIKALPSGYKTLVGERGAQLSGGQKQRIAIARALVKKPSILLLDEATSALDNASEAKVQAALDSASEHCTTLIVAHRLSTIRGADKIVVLSKGRVVEQGTHEELMELKQEYYALVTTQVQSSDALAVKKGDEAVEEIQLDNDDDDRRDSITKKEIAENEVEEFVNVKEASLFSIVQMNAPEWYLLLLGCIGAAAMGCAMPIFAVLFGSIIGVLSDEDADYVRRETNTYCIYFIVAGVMAAVATFFQMYMFGKAGEKLTLRIRSQLFMSLMNQEMGYFDRKENGVGALCAKLSGEAAQVQGATGQRVGSIINALATLILSVGLSMYYEWRLGLLTLAFTPFILVATFFQRRQMAGESEEYRNSLEKSTKIAVEAVTNIRTVAALGCEDTFFDMYIKELVPHLKKTLKNTHGRALVLGLSRSLMFFAYSAAMYYGGYLIRHGMSYEKLFKVAQALIMGTVSIANALAFSPNLEKGIKAATNVVNLFNRVPAIKDQPNAYTKDDANGNVQYSQIHFAYPTRQTVPVLKGLDLLVLQGKTVALVGPSGCGKSTIIQLIERFYDPSSGTVTLDNDDIKSITLASLRSHLGIVSQEPNLFQRSIGENIAYGDNSRNVSNDEIIQAAKNANIHNFISSLPLGYDTKLGEKGTQLSGGQKQRIAIARALVRNPKILLLDEATSALDTESEKIVQEALDNAKIGRTCITIAHRLTTIQDADVICVINEGKVAEMGKHAELIERRGVYYKLYSKQK